MAELLRRWPSAFVVATMTGKLRRWSFCGRGRRIGTPTAGPNI
jgi:hypothetical protein